MAARVFERETDKRAAGEWICMRCALTCKVGEEEQSFGTRRCNRGFLCENIVGIDLTLLGFRSKRLANGVAEPLQRSARSERDAHHVPLAADGMAEGVQPPL